MALIPPIQRFLGKINISKNSCWEWKASKNKCGYGCFTIKNKAYLSHRFIFEYYHGQICPDLTIHHICNNRSCVNPKHLKQVPIKENIFYSPFTIASINSKKTHCPQGHEYTPENIYIQKGGKYCKICKLKRCKEYKQKIKLTQCL